ncbi:MAG: hypothetical protein OSB44_01365 [Verrucomicrobiales bacterium]|nr:hypothetical protein [Verrucomicrobiales bacterium]
MSYFRSFGFIVISLFFVWVSHADDKTEVKDANLESKKQKLLLLIEPRNMRSPVSMIISGARNTVYSAGYMGSLGVIHYKAEEFRRNFKYGWKQFREDALKDAAKHLEKISPVLIKNSENMIEYALIQSQNPLTPSTIILPQFREKFRDLLGPELLVILPNRSTILVFSGSENNLNLYKKTFINMYKDSIYPVSREIFRINGSGIRAIGDYGAK